MLSMDFPLFFNLESLCEYTFVTEIHPTAIVSERVALGDGVKIGPHVIIEDDVEIGDRTEIGAGSFIGRLVKIGRDNHIGRTVQIGGDPQFIGWKPTDSYVVIGSHNTIREFATIHRAELAGDATRIGNHCFIMGTAHIAHDCSLGDYVVVCNGALLAGHVEVGDHAFISGNCAIHQFVRVGRLTMIRGLTAVGKDVVPFTLIDQTNTVRGLNSEGLRRAGLAREVEAQIKEAFREIFHSLRTVSESLSILEAQSTCDEVTEMIEFVRSSRRGVCLAHSTALRGRMRNERLESGDIIDRQEKREI